MMNKYIFGYGSLLDLNSMKSALGRHIDRDHLLSGTVIGYQRKWSAVEIVKLDNSNINIRAVFLDIQRRKNSKTNGVLIKVSENEINRLQRREKNYNCIDISDDIKIYNENNLCGQVYTFTSKKEFRLRPDSTENDNFVMSHYEEKVLHAARCMGTEFYAEYIETTASHSFKKIDGKYKFIDPEQESLV